MQSTFTVTRSASVSRRETQETEKKSLREEFLQKITDAVKPLIEQVAALGARLEALTTELKGAIFGIKEERQAQEERITILQNDLLAMQRSLREEQQKTLELQGQMTKMRTRVNNVVSVLRGHHHMGNAAAPFFNGQHVGLPGLGMDE